MFSDLAYYCLYNYDIKELEEEKIALIQLLIELKQEKNKIKGSYYIYSFFNLYICFFYLIMWAAITIFPSFLFGFGNIFAEILGTIFLFTYLYVIGSCSNLFKGENVIEDYKDLKQKILICEEKLKKLNNYIKK